MADTYIHIGEMLARNARMYPDDVALVERIPAEHARREITWRQFDEASNRFAQVLSQRGITKGAKVIHLMYNSIEWPIAYFGIVRTGAWVVPLNFRFTSADVKYCVKVAEPSLMLFGEEFTERIDAIQDQIQIPRYICAGTRVPAYAEPFEEALEGAPPVPPGVELTYNDSCGHGEHHAEGMALHRGHGETG